MIARPRERLKIKLTQEEGRAVREALGDWLAWHAEIVGVPDEMSAFEVRVRRAVDKLDRGLTWAKGVA